MKKGLPKLLCTAGVFIATFMGSIQAQDAADSTPAPVSGFGQISGRVANEATKEYLRDAVVEIAGLGMSARTDEFGYYTFLRVPAGTYVVSVNYMGLTESRKEVTVVPRRPVTLDFDLTSEIYQMETFTVKGESEGNAAALMRQQSSDNIKNVVAFGGQGGDVTERAADTLIRLPGIAGDMNDEGDITGIYIRGFANMDVISVDGSMAPGSGSMSRNSGAGAFSGAIFEEIEVVKGMTPDMPAGSLSGAVNIKTKNILNMKQKRQISYDFQGRWAATPLWDYIPMREDHPIHPYLSLSWQEIFSVLGGRRNLGVSVGLLHRGNSNGASIVEQFYQRDISDWSQPSYMYDTRYRDYYNLRERTEGNVKFEYRLSPSHSLYLSARVYNDYEREYTSYQLRAYTQENVANFTSYTDDFINVKAGTMRLDSIRYSFKTQNQDYKFGGKHQFGRFHLDYQAAYSNSHNHLRNGPGEGGGSFNMSTAGAWTVDKRWDRDRPFFTQTGGKNIHELGGPAAADMTYGNGGLTRRDGYRDSRNWDIKGNLQYAPDIKWKTVFKAGATYRSYSFSEAPGITLWSRKGSVGYEDVLSGSSVSYADLIGGQLPFVDTEALVREWREYMASRNGEIFTNASGQIYRQDSRATWYKTERNIYDEVVNNLRQTRSASEDVGAVYLQSNTRIGKLTIIGGLRMERTRVEGSGYERTEGNSSATDQHQRALDEWNHPKTYNVSYNNYLPSIHFNYELAKKWKIRASWSTTMGRPALSNYTPAVSVSEWEEIYRLPNPDITPQKAQNIDLEISYSLPSRGLLTAGFFRKDIRDFIYEAIVGYTDSGTAYPGFQERQYVNGDKAKVNGLELAYTQHNFSFLPHPFKGLGCFANLTLLDSSGNYRDDGNVSSTKDLARFVDKTFNAGISYRYKKFYARINVNYTGEHLYTYSDNVNQLVYLKARTITSLRLSYDLNRYSTVYMNIWNILNEPLNIRYQARASQTNMHTKGAPVIEFGIRGTF